MSHLSAIWTPSERHLSTIWVSSESHLNAILAPSECHLSVIWAPSKRHLRAIWVLSKRHLSALWVINCHLILILNFITGNKEDIPWFKVWFFFHVLVCYELMSWPLCLFSKCSLFLFFFSFFGPPIYTTGRFKWRVRGTGCTFILFNCQIKVDLAEL